MKFLIVANINTSTKKDMEEKLNAVKHEGAWRLAMIETINKLVQHHRLITLLQILLRLLYDFNGVKIVRWQTRV